MWSNLPYKPDQDYVSAQTLHASTGDPSVKSGVAIWTFSITKSMPGTTTFSSIDGDLLIVPQSGSLDIRTELGYLLVRQNEICVIPRGIRHNVSLVSDTPCRGYMIELHQGHFQLPNLGVIGSTGLANVRDFQIPVAAADAKLQGEVAVQKNTGEKWTIITRQARALWACEQEHTPFDVVAWHGTNYPYKYDMARFCTMGNVNFDEHDPSLYTILTVPKGDDEGNSVCDFAILPPRWQVAEDTMWLPYDHRNTCSEFYGPILNGSNKQLDKMMAGPEFKPFAAGLLVSMTTHGKQAHMQNRIYYTMLTSEQAQLLAIFNGHEARISNQRN
jgi:homogentisate 1,2-dioxygenase